MLMIWQDILVSRILTEFEVAHLIASAFAILPSQVTVIRQIEDFPDPKSSLVVAEMYLLDGGFRTPLSIWTYFESPMLHEPIEWLRRFAQAADSDCLIGDDAVNPYTWILVDSRGGVSNVSLDMRKLDEDNEYHISQV
jgi:hypothetical protein